MKNKIRSISRREMLKFGGAFVAGGMLSPLKGVKKKTKDGERSPATSLHTSGKKSATSRLVPPPPLPPYRGNYF